MQVSDSVFLVTGGASGLGGATARMLVAGGGKVVIADLKETEGNALAAELGASAKFVRTDVTDEASAKAAVAGALDGFGRLHGIVNCAGIVHGEKVVGKEGPHALASFVRTININLIGSFNITRLAAEAMSRNAPNAGGERAYRRGVVCRHGFGRAAAYAQPRRHPCRHRSLSVAARNRGREWHSRLAEDYLSGC